MAYTFNGTSQYLQLLNTNTPGAYPLTMFIRAKGADITNTQVVAAFIRTSTTYNGFYLAFFGATAGDPINAHGVDSSVSYSDGAWHSWSGRSASATAHDVNADDVVTSNTSSLTFEGYAAVQIGARLNPTFNLGFPGSAGSYAMWDVALSDAECKSLNAGFSPRRVRPQSLKVYAPLVRDLQAWVNKNATTSTFTATASPTVSAHPRSYGL